MWPLLTVVLAVMLAGFWWRSRQREERLRADLARQHKQLAALEEHQRHTLAEGASEQSVVFNSMTEGLLLVDTHRRVRLVNRALEQLFGLKRDIRGNTLIEAFQLHQLEDLANRVATENQVLSFELELRRMDRRFLQVNATILRDRSGQPRGMIFVFHDLTRLRELEDARKEFVANVSHELRTPLSMIKGYVETLIDGAKDDPEISRRFLETIERHADRLTYLIEDLLTLSRLESGQILMNVGPVNLRTLTDDVLADLQGRAQLRQVTLVNQIPPDTTVRIDADRIRQVLFNLVENAIKYGRREGTVVLESRGQDPGKCVVAVRDDGPGIPPESLDRVFERFYRVDKARSRDQGGTGLGLAIVKHIVQSHGGDVRAESVPGQGTTFYFSLPQA